MGSSPSALIYFTFFSSDKTYGYIPLQIIKCYHKTDDIMLCVASMYNVLTEKQVCTVVQVPKFRKFNLKITFKKKSKRRKNQQIRRKY